MAQATSVDEANKLIAEKQKRGYVLKDQEVVSHAEGVFDIFLTFEKVTNSGTGTTDALTDLTAGLYDLRSVLVEIKDKLEGLNDE